MTLLAQFTVEHSVGAPELPNFGAIAVLIVVGFFVLMYLKRVARHYRRRERDSIERMTGRISGYEMTNRILRRHRYGHNRRGRMR